MRGERVERSSITRTYGIPGDRSWAVRDETVGEIRGAKKISALLQCAARCIEEPSDAEVPAIEIALPDGARFRGDDPRLNDALSTAVGRAVSVWPRQPAGDADFYRRRSVIDEADMRAQYGLIDGEPLPDMSAIPPDVIGELTEFVSPRGTFFDAFELHLLTTTSMRALESSSGESSVDVRRFRPNVLVEPLEPESESPELSWLGRMLTVGTAVLQVMRPLQRCVMVTHPLGDLPAARPLLRALVRDFHQDLGVGVRVVEPGDVRVGDTVELP
jgi:uncharacterized protein YcbX